MKGFTDLRLDFGVKRLLPEWRALWKREHAREDVIAGVTVACVALPLSLAIALASGASPAAGIVSAIVAGMICAVFGGTPLAVSGPAAAMAVLIAAVTQAHGAGGLLVVGLVCGALQLATGVLGLGKIIRLVPMPVIEGFTAGIGAIIVIGQLPRVLGLPPPEASRALDVLVHIGELINDAKPASVALALGALAVIFTLPRLLPRAPAPLLAVVIATAAAAWLALDTERIGAIPALFPLPSLPALPRPGAWASVVSSGVLVYALASLESLLSSSAVDKLAGGRRHDPDQELIGQGLGNVASVLAGGIPTTSVIARSALNVQVGAKTRRASMIHSLTLAIAVAAFAPLIARIPVAALAGVLLAVALRMLDPRPFFALLRASRGDAAVYATTFVVIVCTDLVEGVQWGVVAALAMAAIRLGQLRARVHPGIGSPDRLVLSGPLTFLGSLEVERLHAAVAQARRGSALVLDLSGATALDASGADLLINLVASMKLRGLRVAICGLDPALAARVLAADHGRVIASTLMSTEQDAARLICEEGPISSWGRLVHGVDRYREHTLPRYSALFEKLAARQTPHTLFITCSDSRIQPSLITSTDPGELFIVRNIGNLIAGPSTESPSSAGAALEYAVGILGVEEIIVCAHSRCGAIQALLHPEGVPPELESLRARLLDASCRGLCDALPSGLAADDVARLSALRQLDHLREYAVVRAKIEAGSIGIHAWFFDVATGELEEWHDGEQRWRRLGARVGLPAAGPA
jgi:carbonic anhydrase